LTYSHKLITFGRENFRKKNRDRVGNRAGKRTIMKMNFHLSLHLLIPSSPHPFIPFLIPYAAYAAAVKLIVVAAEYTGIVEIQHAEISAERKVLVTTPKVPAVANAFEGTNVGAVTTWEACETAFISAVCVG
jgi:hypothetical protein